MRAQVLLKFFLRDAVTSCVMTFLVALLSWFLLSIPAAMIVGRILRVAASADDARI